MKIMTTNIGLNKIRVHFHGGLNILASQVKISSAQTFPTPLGNSKINDMATNRNILLGKAGLF